MLQCRYDYSITGLTKLHFPCSSKTYEISFRMSERAEHASHNTWRKMKVLVTGAAGFIGSNLAEKLAQRGDEVVGLDNFNDYYDPRKKRANEKRLTAYPNFKMIEADIRDRERMFAIFAAEKFEVVAHLAAMAGVRNAVLYPDLYVEVDLNGTQHLMDAARATENFQNFVFASSSVVTPPVGPAARREPLREPPQLTTDEDEKKALPSSWPGVGPGADASPLPVTRRRCSSLWCHCASWGPH